METLSKTKQSWLSWIFRGVLVLGFIFLLGRLFELQVIKGAYFQGLAEGNRIRRIKIPAPRGRILARGGEVLVGNKEIKKGLVYEEGKGYQFIDDLRGLEGGEIISIPEREYRLGESAAHITGYLGEVNEEEVGKINPDCSYKGVYFPGSLVGRTGLEEQYECLLSGIDGEELVEVDSAGEKIRTIGIREPIKGEDLKTSIHFGLQKRLAESFEDKKGAGVVTDIGGQILAFYSSPSYDPNLFIQRKDAEVKKLLQSPDLPFFNRVIAGSYHPGSVFKPIVAIAGLEEGVIDEDFTYIDEGKIELKTNYGTFTYNNWYFTQSGGVEGKIDLKKALARSTDTFFYKLGEFLGVRNIGKWANKFGLGKETGIDLPGEISGLVPDPAWKRRVKGERWFLGNTYHMAIGQGDMALTVLGINSAISAIAANGKLCTPSFFEDGACKDLGVEKDNIDIVKDGMTDACMDGGTGYPFFNFSPRVACKTGTAETGADKENHAWFTVFGPLENEDGEELENPEIVGTFLVEEGGEGSKVAAPIAREVFDYWFGVNKNP